MNNIKLSNDVIKYILYQRTELLVFVRNKILMNILKIYCKAFKKNILDTMVNFECVIRKKRIKQDYIKLMRSEYDTLKDNLPSNIKNYMDIGCGIALINIFIKEKLGDEFDKLILLDRTKTDKLIYYSYTNIASFYNSLELAKETLIKNGFDEKSICVL